MLDFIENLFKQSMTFFIDRDKSITQKLSIGILILGLLIVVDDQIGLSFFYSSSQKISQAQKLSTIMRSDSIDAQTKQELRALQLKILRRKGTISYLWDFTKSAINSRSAQITNPKPNSIIVNQRNIVFHVLSSNWALLILAFVGVTGLLLQKKVGGNEISAIIIIVCGIGFIVILFSYAFSLIPIIHDKPGINYALNALLHLLIFIIIARIIGRSSG